MTPSAALTIGIAGAGSTGCFVGGRLAAAGHRVALLARPRVIAEIETAGLRLSAVDGDDATIAADRLTLSDDPSIFVNAAIILVTVKSTDTEAMGALIAQHARADAAIVSLQNGVGNADVLRKALPQHRVLAGMVPFNVVGLGDGRFRRTTFGDIVIAKDADDTAGRLAVPGLPIKASADIDGVLWGKLLVNLGNAINALSDLPLRTQLMDREWRLVLAAQQAEALNVLRAAGIAIVAATPLPPRVVPYVMRLPDRLFTIVLDRMMKIDPQARSSMWDDLQRRRRTEIDFLQGTVIALAQRHGVAVPLSRRIVDLVKSAESAGLGSPGLTPAQMWL